MVKLLETRQNLLACARKRKGWTQAYVAQQVNVSVETVRQWERGRHLPYQVTIQRLCELFQMTPEELGLLNGQALLSHADETLTDPRNLATPKKRQRHVLSAPTDEQKAAWAVYVELVTRIATVPLENNTGLLREALSSLYTLFHFVRAILRSSHPDIVSQHSGAHLSLCAVGVRMLNTTLRPLLAKWHPLLKEYEDQRPVSVGILTYEQQWEKSAELRKEIALTQRALIDYAKIFAQIAGVSSPIEHGPENDL